MQNADTWIMGIAGFEDTVFLLNIRIRMVRDTIRLNPPDNLFMESCLGDIAFIDRVLAVLAAQITENAEQQNVGETGDSADAQTGNDAADGNANNAATKTDTSVLDYATDTEWQFSQLLTEFLLESNSFSANTSQEDRSKVVALRESSDSRRKAFEKLFMSTPDGLSEQVVSPTELSILFGGS